MIKKDCQESSSHRFLMGMKPESTRHGDSVFSIFNFTIRFMAIPLFFLAPGYPQSQGDLLSRSFHSAYRIHHSPPSPFFKGRPYHLELFVDIPRDSLKAVSLFLKTEKFLEYQEIALDTYRGRYRFTYDPVQYPGDTLSYFFAVTATDFRIYATPLDTLGRIKPLEVHPLDPEKYYGSPER
ncbi:MAG: hypothetical protein ACE5GH_05940 [Fidelibacterota bacterium]